MPRNKHWLQGLLAEPSDFLDALMRRIEGLGADREDAVPAGKDRCRLIAHDARHTVLIPKIRPIAADNTAEFISKNPGVAMESLSRQIYHVKEQKTYYCVQVRQPNIRIMKVAYQTEVTC